MKKLIVFFSITTLLFLVVHFALADNNAKPPRCVQVYWQAGKVVEQLEEWHKTQWQTAVERGEPEQLQKTFLQGRNLYKQIEWLVEYYFPSTAKSLNGPPLPEIEMEEHQVYEPSGFQVIEELIFPSYDPAQKEALIRESKRWKSLLHRLKALWPTQEVRDDQLFEALRLQLFRMMTLGLAGFDTPLSGTSLKEMVFSLQGIQAALSIYTNAAQPSATTTLTSLLQRAKDWLTAEQNFHRFDRLRFITEVIQPLSKEIYQLHQELGIPFNQTFTGTNNHIQSFFDSGWYNVNFFTPFTASWVTSKKVALGKQLFSDPVLSLNHKTACASCHHPAKAFSDGLRKSKALGSSGSLQRNTPSLFYAGYQQKQFYDMRASYLEDQVKAVIENKDEIHGSLREAAKRLNIDPQYLALFRSAFKNQEDSITEQHVQIVLAAYVRSLAPFQSRFDKHMRGEAVLTSDEKDGFNLYMGKAKCGTCHFMPLFNGTVPPAYTTTESEIIGVPAHKYAMKLDSDKGRYGIYQLAELSFAFKTPTLRNIALTAPYMHNGVFDSLEEVVAFYNKGGGAGQGIKLEHQTLPAEPLHLTNAEKKKLVSFLKTLTDE